jgi:hypothetical protein
VRAALGRWFAQQGVRVDVVPGSEGAALRFTLASGEGASIVPGPEATVDARLPALLERAAAFVEDQNALFDQELGHPEDFVLRAPRFREAHRKVWEAAARGRRLMLLGASGTGKDRLAECYHRHSARADGPFKAVNCALVEKEMIWVQLFGAARGSFTGAVRDVDGAVAAAHGGTLFLDEVGELSPGCRPRSCASSTGGASTSASATRGRAARTSSSCAPPTPTCAARWRAGSFAPTCGSASRARWSTCRRSPSAPRTSSRSSTGRASRPPSPPATRSPRPPSTRPPPPVAGNFRELENFVQRLPLAARPRSVALDACLAALAEGSPVPVAPAPAPVASPASWERVLAEATASYRAHRDGAGPQTFGDVKDFIDGHLKPAFVAAACGVASGEVPVEGVNFSAAARGLDVGDGTTIKRWLERYFANRSAP